MRNTAILDTSFLRFWKVFVSADFRPCITTPSPMRERIWAVSLSPPTGEKTGDFPPVFIQFWVPPAGHKKTPQVCVTYGVWDRKRVLTFHISTLCPASIKFLTSHRVPCLWKHWFYWTCSCFLIRRRGTVRPLHICPKMGITKGHKQNIVCGLNSQSFIVDPLKGYKNQRQPISASASPFIDQLSEKAPHNVSWYKLVWSRNQCQLFRTTSCSPLSDNVFLIIIILAPFVKSEKLIYLFWFLLKWSLQSSYYLISLVLKCMVDSVADFVKIKPFVMGQSAHGRLPTLVQRIEGLPCFLCKHFLFIS